MRYIGILLILLCVLSCQNSNVSNSSFEDLEDGYYPKGRIPEWVKETLSEDGYKILQQLSQNYETVYIKELQMENKEFLDYLTKYDNLLNYTNNSDTIEEINNKVLNKYNEIF